MVYAIGEIVLVVIGILIALQINNMNEKRTSELELNLKLKELKNSISYEVDEYTSASKDYTHNTEYLTSVLLKRYNKVDLREFAFQIAILPVSLSEPSIYQNLSSEGSINDLESDALIYKIRDYYEVDRHKYRAYTQYHENTVTSNIEGIIYWDVLSDSTGQTVVEALMPDLENGKYNSVLSAQISNFKNLNEIVNHSKRKTEDLIISIDNYLKDAPK